MELFSSELLAHLTAHKIESRMCRGVKKTPKKNQFEGEEKKRRCRENSDEFEGRGEPVKYEE